MQTFASGIWFDLNWYKNIIEIIYFQWNNDGGAKNGLLLHQKTIVPLSKCICGLIDRIYRDEVSCKQCMNNTLQQMFNKPDKDLSCT